MSHFFYEVIRKAFFLGLRVKPIVQELGLKQGEKLLDAGCGYGFFYPFCKGADYTGIDLDPERITWAKNKIGENDHTRFICSSVFNIDHPSNYFDRAIGYGLLHHLSDDEARSCLREMSRVTRKWIVFSEPVYTKYHLINNILCNLDQGRYVRTQSLYLDLCRPFFKTLSSSFFYARNGLAKYLLISGEPR